ncbi:MAG: roadblock/LC7 domain-containing protein [Candidatus Thermoplasmatota archaeon]|jgi:predicted regulator of Ras-like GTPase activity (Roadblock/LC7/MglB family)|nr:roadblock/LC7 domain-containing protein [Candidatus Thermoplasmatota archaeon]MCL5874131.1 roadblock/LC7 domain-containing protein [Candidatus Thermoplasmatota archaeon]
MDKETVDGLLEEYAKKPYVRGTVLLSSIGVPIAINKSRGAKVDSYAPLVSITYEGAQELASTAGKHLGQLSVELRDGGRIVIRQVRESFLLAVQVQRYDDRIEKEINFLSNRVSKLI